MRTTKPGSARIKATANNYVPFECMNCVKYETHGIKLFYCPTSSFFTAGIGCPLRSNLTTPGKLWFFGLLFVLQKLDVMLKTGTSDYRKRSCNLKVTSVKHCLISHSSQCDTSTLNFHEVIKYRFLLYHVSILTLKSLEMSWLTVPKKPKAIAWIEKLSMNSELRSTELLSGTEAS